MSRSIDTTTGGAAGRKPRSPLASLRRVRILALALVAGALLVSPTVAQAQPKPPADPGVRCAAKIGPGEYEFYMPGAKVTDKDGNRWVCGPDGMWFRDYSAITGVRPPLAPQVTGSAVLAP
jgi:hypothetical protein